MDVVVRLTRSTVDTTEGGHASTKLFETDTREGIVMRYDTMLMTQMAADIRMRTFTVSTGTMVMIPHSVPRSPRSRVTRATSSCPKGNEMVDVPLVLFTRVVKGRKWSEVFSTPARDRFAVPVASRRGSLKRNLFTTIGSNAKMGKIPFAGKSGFCAGGKNVQHRRNKFTLTVHVKCP